MIGSLILRFLPAFLHPAVNRIRESPKQGIPPGLQTDAVNHAATKLYNGKILSIYYKRLRSWRKSGTFRIFLNFTDGRTFTMIYKRMVYSIDEIPANDKLPAKQGPPEYLVASILTGPLVSFKPITYWQSHNKTEECFEYLFEDLQDDYVPFVDYQKTHSERSICKSLAEMHRALREQIFDLDRNMLIKFDNDYARKVWIYTLDSLPGYYKLTGDPIVNKFLKDSSKIEAEFFDPFFESNRPKQIIHGDCNGTNIWVKEGTNALEMKAVDWEWAGYGMPHADLISILKWRTKEEKEDFLKEYCANAGLTDISRETRWLKRANMERAILDAGFLAKQYQNPKTSKEWFKTFVHDSLVHLIQEASVS